MFKSKIQQQDPSSPAPKGHGVGKRGRILTPHYITLKWQNTFVPPTVTAMKLRQERPTVSQRRQLFCEALAVFLEAKLLPNYTQGQNICLSGIFLGSKSMYVTHVHVVHETLNNLQDLQLCECPNVKYENLS